MNSMTFHDIRRIEIGSEETLYDQLTGKEKYKYVEIKIGKEMRIIVFADPSLEKGIEIEHQ